MTPLRPAPGTAVPLTVGPVGPAAACAGAGWAEPFIVRVGWSSGRGGTADRSYPHAPQKRSPASSGSAQLGHVGRAACRGIWDINYTHVRGR
ncbi:hypothetical protein ACIA6D_38490 [Streptomyces cacaoi]|uniref:hypothetical protein n=1 Tax=Streptomyces cacaoi TaxID=1898 RepID=UPI0037480EC4